MICEMVAKLPTSMPWAGCGWVSILLWSSSWSWCLWNQQEQHLLDTSVCMVRHWLFHEERNWFSLICVEEFILLIILRKVTVQKYTCQLIRLQLEVHGDMLTLSSTKSAAFLPAPWNYKEREWRGLVYTLKVLPCLGTLFGYCISQPSKSLQLFSLEKLNGWSELGQLVGESSNWSHTLLWLCSSWQDTHLYPAGLLLLPSQPAGFLLSWKVKAQEEAW